MSLGDEVDLAAQADRRSRATADGRLASLFEQQWMPLVRTASLMLGGRAAAEDVVQEAFVRLDRHLRRLPDEASEVRYLRTIVVNLCRSTIRRRLIALKHAPQSTNEVTGVEAQAIAHQACVEVTDALLSLPVRQRQALVLRFYADMTEREVAEVMGISVGTVKSSVSRAKDALATRLEGQR